MTSKFLNKIIDWIDLFSKDHEIDFYDPAFHLNYNINEIHYDEDRIIFFMRHIGSWSDDFYVLNINEIKNLKEERKHLFCSIVKDGVEIELIFTQSVVIHHDSNYENKVLKIKEQDQCCNLDGYSLSKVYKEFEELEAPKIKKIIEYYSLKYPQISKGDLLLTLIENYEKIQ